MKRRDVGVDDGDGLLPGGVVIPPLGVGLGERLGLWLGGREVDPLGLLEPDADGEADVLDGLGH